MTNMVALRKLKGMTQTELAKQMGVTQGAVMQWEKQMLIPSPNRKAKLAKLLGCKPEDLYEEFVLPTEKESA